MSPTIPVALSTGSVYTYGTARVFALAAQAGYDGVELLVDDRWDTRQAGYVRGLMEHTGLPVLSVHSPFASLRLPGWPRAEIERIKLALQLAEALGARTLNVHLPLRVRLAALSLDARRLVLPLPGPSADQRAFAHWLGDGGLAELQATTPVAITVENLPQHRLLGRRYSPNAFNTWPELRRFPKVCLDTTHAGTAGADLLAVLEYLAERVVHIHLSDYDGHFQHRPLGRGQLPLGPFLQAVARRGFSGVVVVELEPGGLPVHDEAALLAELRRNLDFCRQHLGQADERAASAAAAPAGA
jgi:sugar phosphate isomerase/epimerase